MIRTAEQVLDYLAAAIGKNNTIVKSGPRMIFKMDDQIFSLEVKWEGDTRRDK